MAASPARNTVIWAPNVAQADTIIRATSAVRGSPSQSTGPRPARASVWLITPSVGWYIQRHTSAIATTEATQGRKNRVRTIATVRERRASSSATPSAPAIETGTYRAYSRVWASAVQTVGARTG